MLCVMSPVTKNSRLPMVSSVRHDWFHHGFSRSRYGTVCASRNSPSRDRLGIRADQPAITSYAPSAAWTDARIADTVLLYFSQPSPIATSRFTFSRSDTAMLR